MPTQCKQTHSMHHRHPFRIDSKVSFMSLLLAIAWMLFDWIFYTILQSGEQKWIRSSRLCLLVRRGGEFLWYSIEMCRSVGALGYFDLKNCDDGDDSFLAYWFFFWFDVSHLCCVLIIFEYLGQPVHVYYLWEVIQVRTYCDTKIFSTFYMKKCLHFLRRPTLHISSWFHHNQINHTTRPFAVFMANCCIPDPIICSKVLNILSISLWVFILFATCTCFYLILGSHIPICHCFWIRYITFNDDNITYDLASQNFQPVSPE